MNRKSRTGTHTANEHQQEQYCLSKGVATLVSATVSGDKYGLHIHTAPTAFWKK